MTGFGAEPVFNSGMKRHPGFTLVEIVIAIFIFSIGALGLAATTAAILRSLGESDGRERAGRIAVSRIEAMRALSCASVQSGSEIREGVRSSWVASGAGSGISAVETVSYLLADGTHADTLTAVFACAP